MRFLAESVGWSDNRHGAAASISHAAPYITVRHMTRRAAKKRASKPPRVGMVLTSDEAVPWAESQAPLIVP